MPGAAEIEPKRSKKHSSDNTMESSPKNRPLIARAATMMHDLSPVTTRSTLPARPDHSRKHHLDFLHGHGHKRHDEKHTGDTSGSDATALRKRHTMHNPNTSSKAGPSRMKAKGPSPQDSTVGPVAKPVQVNRQIVVRPADVVKERERGLVRDEELHESLNELSTLAHQSTRHLDSIYYSLLEKVETLRSMIGSLQQLSSASDHLHRQFKEDVTELEGDIRGQVDAFGGFNDQQSRIEELEARIKAGVGRAEELSNRLEICRKKAEAREKQEKEWQARTSKQLNWGSGVLAAIFVGIVLFLIIRRIQLHSSFQQHIDLDGIKKLLQNGSLPMFAMDDLAQVISARITSTTSATYSTSTASDTRLMAFDEL